MREMRKREKIVI